MSISREMQNVYGYPARKVKSKAQYERLFEDLMQYTSFTSTKQIETNGDLKKFFEELKDNAKTDRQRRGLSKSSLHEEMKDALKRIKSSKNEKYRKSVKITESNKEYGSYAKAKEYYGIARDLKGNEVYKSGFTYKNKHVIRYRDMKGRFVSIKDLLGSEVLEEDN